MTKVNKKEPGLLLLGDLIIFIISLWLSLLIRLGSQLSVDTFFFHLTPFSILFAIWVLVFFIAGLYEKQTLFFRKRLLTRISNAQVFNSFLAVVFFYFIPYFGITPKTILFVYLVISFGLIFLWRVYSHKLFALHRHEPALLLGSGSALVEIMSEVNNNPRYGFYFVDSFDLDKIEPDSFQKKFSEKITNQKIVTVVVDFEHKNIKTKFPQFYNLFLSRVRFIDFNSLYENIFDRVSLTSLDHSWFLRNISLAHSDAYDAFKRACDIVLSLILGILSLLLYPFIYLAIKFDDGGTMFIIQKRVGQNNTLVNIYKFRTMSFNDNGQDGLVGENRNTRVGVFLRVSRLDELPQLWNVLKGDLSLIGPRPELPVIAEAYEKEIPYYSVRHLIKPGLSGWAQLYHMTPPKREVNIIETKNKLSYDLYYIKNRSLALDLKIILKTIKTLLSRSGK